MSWAFCHLPGRLVNIIKQHTYPVKSSFYVNPSLYVDNLLVYPMRGSDGGLKILKHVVMFSQCSLNIEVPHSHYTRRDPYHCQHRHSLQPQT